MRRKLKILAAGDIHGDSRLANQLAERANKEKVDLVIRAFNRLGLPLKIAGVGKMEKKLKIKIILV